MINKFNYHIEVHYTGLEPANLQGHKDPAMTTHISDRDDHLDVLQYGNVLLSQERVTIATE